MNFDPRRKTQIVPGAVLGRYTLLLPLEEGGMGAVWAAREKNSGELVAVKIMLPSCGGDPKFRAMFLDESRIASAIDHPNVARHFDRGEEDGTLYLAMEYVEGDCLARLDAASRDMGQRIPPALVLRLVADACSGLHAAHELRDASGALLDVVHRDMSPHNILVSTAGVAKIVDFGIAKARGRMSGDTTDENIKGKVCYMPREQAVGERIDRRTDVWAMGSVLYYLLSGQHVFGRSNDTAVLHALLRRDPIPPLPAPTPPAVAEVVTRALAYDPGERYSTAAEMRRALEDAMRLSGLAASARDVAAGVSGFLGRRMELRRAALAGVGATLEDREALDAILGATSAPSSRVGAGQGERAQPSSCAAAAQVGGEPSGAAVTQTVIRPASAVAPGGLAARTRTP